MIYTFYSYKGGVGRTMALANIAELLCQQGLRVVIIDWDLESPALEHYFPAVTMKALFEKGLVDLVQDFKRVMSTPPDGQEREDASLPLPEISKYLQHVHPEDDEKKLWLLAPGMRAGGVNYARYAEEVRFFDWRDFYRNWEGELFFEWLRRELNQVADAVLINSRAGISEVSHVCTRLMADAVVMFCSASQQNIQGTFEVASELATARRPQGPRGPVRMLIVPARVERTEAALLDRFREDFLRKFHDFLPAAAPVESDFFWNFRVPQVPYYSFKEEVATRESREPHAAEMVASYRKIAAAMAALMPPRSQPRELSPAQVLAAGQGLPAPRQDDGPPYRSLEPFYQEHAHLFYGRRRDITRACELLKTAGLLIVVGQSGSGKSSLVYAGLLPEIAAGRLPESGTWPVAIFKPGSDPFLAMAAALSPLLPTPPAESRVDVRKLADDLAGRDGALAEVVGQALEGRPAAARLLMVIDQFEELFTLSQVEATRLNFQDQLVGALRGGRLSVILTLRADFKDTCLKYEPFAAAAEGRLFELGPMSRDEYMEAVVTPASKRGVELEPGLIERILIDVGQEPGNLPLLQFALTELWNRRQGGRLTHGAYDVIGGVQGAVTRRADEEFAKLSPEGQATARKVFTQLVHLGEGDGAKNTRRRATFDEMGESAGVAREVVKSLVEARLLVCSSGPGRRGATEEYIEVAHEALIQGWDTLGEWLKDNEERLFLLWRQHLRQRMAEAVRARRSGGALRRLLPFRDRDALLRGFSLDSARWWLQKRAADLSASERTYITESIRARRLRRGMIVATLLAASIIFILVYAKQTSQTKTFENIAEDYYQRGLVSQQKEDWDDALKSFDRVIEIDPHYFGAYRRRAEIYARQGKYDEAIDNYSEYLARAPEDAATHNNLGSAYLARYLLRQSGEDLAEARKHLDTAIRLGANFGLAYYDRGRLSESEGLLEDAISNYNLALQRNPNLYQALIAVGRLYYQRGASTKSPDDLRRAFDAYSGARTIVETEFGVTKEKNVGYADPFNELGIYYLWAGDRSRDVERNPEKATENYRLAVENFDKAIEFNPRLYETFNGRGLAHKNLGEMTAAVADFERAIELNNGYLDAYGNLAAVYRLGKNYDKAIENYAEVLGRQPENVEALIGAGESYAAKGDHDLAIENLSKASKLTPVPAPVLADIYFRLGVSYAAKNMKSAARANFEDFLRAGGDEGKRREAKRYLEHLGYNAPRPDAVVSIYYGAAVDGELVTALRDALTGAGFRVNQPSLTTQELPRVSVRNFHKQDRDNAEKVKEIIGGVLEEKSFPQAVERDPFLKRGNDRNFGLIEVFVTIPAPTPTPPPDLFR